jgi:hypothetical protein
MPYILASEAAFVMAISPGVPNSVVVVIAPRVMANPAVSVDMWVVRVPVSITEIVMLVVVMRVAMIRLRSVSRGTSMRVSKVVVLGKCRQREGEQHCQSHLRCAHGDLLHGIDTDVRERCLQLLCRLIAKTPILIQHLHAGRVT